MTPRTLAVLLCRAVAVLIVVQSLQYLGELAVSSEDIYTGLLYSTRFYDTDGFIRFASLLVYIIICLNLAVLFWFFAPTVSCWMLGKESTCDTVEKRPLLEWQTLGLNLLAVYLIATCLRDYDNLYIYYTRSRPDLLDWVKTGNLLGSLFQMLCGVYILYRGRALSRFLLRPGRDI